MNDIVDRAQLEEQAWLNEQVRQARVKTQANTDDECVDCGRAIGAKRKQYVPSATRCIVCQNKLEKRQK